MQSQDQLGRIQQLTQVDFGKVDDLVAKVNAAEEKGAVSHTIGKLPKGGEIVTLNGLSYRVDFADHVRGKFTVKLILRDKESV